MQPQPQPSACLALPPRIAIPPGSFPRQWHLFTKEGEGSGVEGGKRGITTLYSPTPIASTSIHNCMLQVGELKGLISAPGGHLHCFPLDRQHTTGSGHPGRGCPPPFLIFLRIKLSSNLTQQNSLPKTEPIHPDQHFSKQKHVTARLGPHTSHDIEVIWEIKLGRRE